MIYLCGVMGDALQNPVQGWGVQGEVAGHFQALDGQDVLYTVTMELGDKKHNSI